jgi:serine/threonine-protein kinase
MNASDKFNAYDNPTLGIRIDYPSNWSVSEHPYNPAANNTVVGFLSPSKTGSELGNVSGVSGSFVPYLDLYVFDSKKMPLDMLFNMTKSKFLNNENFAIIESKPILLKGNRQAFEIVYDAIVGGDEQLRKVQAYTIVDGKVYTISFTSQAALFSDYLPTVHKMIYSFEAKDKNPG